MNHLIGGFVGRSRPFFLGLCKGLITCKELMRGSSQNLYRLVLDCSGAYYGTTSPPDNPCSAIKN